MECSILTISKFIIHIKKVILYVRQDLTGGGQYYDNFLLDKMINSNMQRTLLEELDAEINAKHSSRILKYAISITRNFVLFLLSRNGFLQLGWASLTYEPGTLDIKPFRFPDILVFEESCRHLERFFRGGDGTMKFPYRLQQIIERRFN